LNRNKILALIHHIYGEQDTFTGIVQFDERSVHLSFKGKKNPAFFVNILGRLPRHHMTAQQKMEWLKKNGFDNILSNEQELNGLLYEKNYLPYSNRDQVCILTGKDQSNNAYAKAVCIGAIESQHITKELTNRVTEQNILVTDGNNVYNDFADTSSIQHEVVISTAHAKGPFNLGAVNGYHLEMGRFWSDSKENLPPTKNLQLGLSLFWWLDKNKELSLKEKVSEILGYIKNTPFNISREELKNMKVDIDFKFNRIPVQM
jgi:hypothetical protein